MIGPLEGKGVVVTGSSSGIGKAIALAMAEAGANVVVNFRQSMGAAKTVTDEIRARGRLSYMVRADVSRPDQAEALVRTAWEALGGIDIWVNNAGADIISGDNRKLNRMEKLAMVLDVDVRGTAICSWLVGERMRDAGGGVILNMGWDKAVSGMAGETAELFAISKAGVMGFTRSLARSLAPTVRVNCLAPGYVETAWGQQTSDDWRERVVRETPLARWGSPADIAPVAVFLCCDAASFITGQIVNINGGVV